MKLSRSEEKRRHKLLEKLTATLLELPINTIKKIPCCDEIREEIILGRDLQGGARKRQTKYICKGLAGENTELLYAFVAARQGNQLQKKKQAQELGYLRDRLLDEAMAEMKEQRMAHLPFTPDWSSQIIPEMLVQFPDLDSQTLLNLAHRFVRSGQQRHSREIYKILVAAAEQQRFIGPSTG